MAQREGAKPFRVAVVGLPSSSPGTDGAGKSCLCNRFTHRGEDAFSNNHSSVINHEDFTGPIVNSTHFIYWGQTSYCADDGTPVYFQIIEQTEFCQDGSFKVFSSAQPYLKRAFATKNLPSSSGKVAYYGPDQFADVQKYPNPEKFPDKFQIDGFIVCVDVSMNLVTATPELQKFYDKLIMESLATKKPIVIAATKCDKMNPATLERLQGLVSKQKRQVPVVETSSAENVSVEIAFFLLAEGVGKVKFKTKLIHFTEAQKQVFNRNQQATDAFNSLLKEMITDCQLNQQQAVEAIKQEQAYDSVVVLCGSSFAKTLVRKHLRHIHSLQVDKKKAQFLESLPYCLDQLVPDIDSSADIKALLEAVRLSDQFSVYFVELYTGMEWAYSPVLNSPDKIIPFQFLESDPEALQLVKEHLLLAQAQHQHHVAMEKIRNTMETSKLKPGCPLEELMESLNLSNELNLLRSRDELNKLYISLMKTAETETLKEFKELLWEHPEMFIARTKEQQEMLESSVESTLSSNMLMEEPRFQRLCYRGSKCKAEVLRHLALFAVKKGEIKKSAFQEFVASNFPKQEALIVDETSPWVLDTTDVYYNIALVGKEEICGNLKNDIMGLCKSGRFKYQQMDYQFVMETFPSTTAKLCTDNFTPQGAILVVSSEELLIATEALTKLFFSISSEYRGLPVATLFIGEEFTADSKNPLSTQAVRLSRWLQAHMVAEKRSVFPDRVLTANSASSLVAGLLERTRHTEAFLRIEMCPKITDMSVAMCTTPDESYDHEVLLPPFLANQLAFYKDDHVMVQTQVEEKFYSVAISYHSSTNLESLLSSPPHGFIVVYSAGRKASWKIATFLVSQLPQIPTLLVCVHNTTVGDDLMNAGELLAKEKEHVLFLTTDGYWQPGCLNEFFTKCWFSRFSSMHKQHVKVKPQISARALPNRPQSDHISLRSLPSTPNMSNTLPRTPFSPASTNQLGTLREIFTIEDDIISSDTYDTADGCVISRTTRDNTPPTDEPIEYATSASMRSLVNEHKFKSLPRLPSSASSGVYSEASVSRITSSSDESGSLYSLVEEQGPSTHSLPTRSSSVKTYGTVDKEQVQSQPPEELYSVVQKPAVKRKPQRHQPVKDVLPGEELYSVIQKPNSKTSAVQEQPQDVYSVVNKPKPQMPVEELYSVVHKPAVKGKPAMDELYSVVNKPPVKEKSQKPAMDELYSVVNKPPVKEKPQKPAFDELYSVVDRRKVRSQSVKQRSEPVAEEELPSVAMQLQKTYSADLYAEVKPKLIPWQQKGLENGDLYALVDKPKRPAPTVARKPVRQKRYSSDSSVLMATNDSQSHDSGFEDKPALPDRCYDDESLDLDDEPPPLPPRMYSLSDFESEDELCFDDIMSGDELDRTADGVPSTASVKSSDHDKREEANPLYQSLASIRREIEDAKTGIAKFVPSSQKSLKLQERLRRQAEKEKARRLKQEERNQKRQEETKKRLEDSQIREEKKQLRKKRLGPHKQMTSTKLYNPFDEAAGGHYFGLPLQEVCSDEHPIPVYVEQCAQLIEEMGIKQLGIYRVSGKKDDVLELHKQFDDNPKMDIRPLDMCTSALASGLKSFFKLLPDPLISESMGNQLLSVAKLPVEDQLFKLSNVINEMPQVNRRILHFLATHLNKIIREQEVNKMNASNLAIVFWPTLLRPPLADLADLSKQIDWQLMMTRIIENPDISCGPS